MALNFSVILGMIPLIMKAVNVAQEIGESSKSGASVVKILEGHGQQVLEIVTQAGAALFPNLPKSEQAQAGVTRFDPQLVSRIQLQLNELGANLAVDGDYGPRTKAAVTEFQKKNGLDADGWAGPLTQAKLNGMVKVAEG